ncbi:MAG TPA: sigma-70 family RNA polymerase sigma factor [Terriglobales bacterium]|jgi:RNA polymerase sigma factor (TIGR02999 family)
MSQLFDPPLRAKEQPPVDSSAADVTVLLEQLAQGNQQAGDRLIPLVYDELRRIAGRYMRREKADHVLQTTALVHEAYLKLVEQRSVEWQGRTHFYAIAASLMRRILIDDARKRIRAKRGGGQSPVMLDEALVYSPGRSSELLEIDGALQRLAEIDQRQAKVVELRFFAGLSVEETAEVLGISPKTVKRDWSVARAWLHGELKGNHGDAAGEVGRS